MGKNKFLHREKYIRLGGVLLLVSPVFNFLMSFALQQTPASRWSFGTLSIFASAVSWTSYGLYFSSMVVGAFMLKGRRSTWAFALVVLGFYVIWNCIHFSHDAREGLLQPILALAVNCGLFGLVYMQEFHQQMYGQPPIETTVPGAIATAVVAPATNAVATPQAPAEIPALKILRIPIRVDFDGVGPWAQITSISNQEVRMQSLHGSYPQGLESYAVELELGDGSIVRAEFTGMDDQDFVFKCLTPASPQTLARWSA